MQGKYLAITTRASSNECQKADTASTVSQVKAQREAAGHREGSGTRPQEQEGEQDLLRDGSH